MQLSDPHLRFPAHSESESQSPPPTLHGFLEEQQLQSVEGTPLHLLPGGWVVVVFGEVDAKIVIFLLLIDYLLVHKVFSVEMFYFFPGKFFTKIQDLTKWNLNFSLNMRRHKILTSTTVCS